MHTSLGLAVSVCLCDCHTPNVNLSCHKSSQFVTVNHKSSNIVTSCRKSSYFVKSHHTSSQSPQKLSKIVKSHQSWSKILKRSVTSCHKSAFVTIIHQVTYITILHMKSQPTSIVSISLKLFVTSNHKFEHVSTNIYNFRLPKFVPIIQNSLWM